MKRHNTRDLDWVVDLLVDLHAFCEQNDLDTVSNRLAVAIEEAAPIIRGARPDRTVGARTALSGQIAQAALAGASPRRLQPDGRPRLVAVRLAET